MIIDYFYKIQNLLIRKFFEIDRIDTTGKVVYLTFDDGPESGITEFVLNELNKYNFKATFFCCGDKAEHNKELFDEIIRNGHSIGNHTYSHIHSYQVDSKTYVKDVGKANEILHTKLFRPPHGSVTFPVFLRLKKHYNLYFWNLNSFDYIMDKCDINKNIEHLKTNTSSGDIVLFHFCNKHSAETSKILPVYLKWLYDNGFASKSL